MSTLTRSRRAETTRRGQVATSPRGWWLSVVLSVLLVAATCYGLVYDEAYRVSPGVRENLPDVLRGQDLLTLMTVPVLLWLAHRARRGSLTAHLGWLGLQLYYLYGYVMYAFAPFNDVFLVYVAVMGLAGYALLDGLFRIDMTAVVDAVEEVPRRGVAGFLIAVALLFYGLWLSMILPAIPGGLPDGRVVYDIASAVHVLDLAFILPLLLATGFLLLRRQAAGVVLAVVLLCKMVTLGLAMLSMNLVFVPAAEQGEVFIWGVVTAVSAVILVAVVRRMQTPGVPWLRPGLWH
jgi:hypothetical protein